MNRLMCTRCGETLHCEDGLLKCSYCGAAYEKESLEETLAKLEEALGRAKIELIANRKRHLWDVAHEKYPSKEKVVEAANAVLSISAEDFLARIYLHSHDRDPLKLNSILASSSVNVSQADEAFRWLLPSLSLRTVGPLHDFVDRHFSGKERFSRITQIEDEASKISQGMYEPALPRDVFLCYSSQDMVDVISLLDLLEQNGFACFAAFRNLRHGKGAQEDYLAAIQTAMRSCDVLVFVSSEASRSMDCDALRVELAYLIQELPNKPRVEFVIEDYGDTPFMVKRTLKKAFPTQERCYDEEDLMIRIQNALEDLSSDGKPKEEQKEGEQLSIIGNQYQSIDIETIRKEAEEKAREALLREKLEEEARERILAARAAEREEKKAAMKAEARIPFVEGNYVYYGRYPQTKETDLSIVRSIRFRNPQPNGYISYNGKEYAKVDGDYYLVQPIKWLILRREGDEAIVVSDRILSARAYSENYSNNYKDSGIREWLNGEFLSTAFALGDKHILATEIDNSGETTESPSNPFACENTRDRVFLLSYKDYADNSYGFSGHVSRQCAPTAFAYAKGAYRNADSGAGYYWTRSPSSYFSTSAWCISNGGDRFSNHVGSSDRGVRPAIRIKIEE